MSKSSKIINQRKIIYYLQQTVAYIFLSFIIYMITKTLYFSYQHLAKNMIFFYIDFLNFSSEEKYSFFFSLSILSSLFTIVSIILDQDKSSRMLKAIYLYLSFFFFLFMIKLNIITGADNANEGFIFYYIYLFLLALGVVNIFKRIFP